MDEEDWQCLICRDTQFARNEKCRKCGAAKPSNNASITALQNALLTSSRGGGGASSLALGNSSQPTNSDWCCPKCRDMNFGSRSSCRSCGTSRPVDPMQALHRAVNAQNTQNQAQLKGVGSGVPGMGHASGAVGFLPAGANPVSSWQTMWSGETPNGMLVGEQLPDWMKAKPDDSKDETSGSESDSSGSSSSTSSGSGGGSDVETDADQGSKAEGKEKRGEGGKDKKKKEPRTNAQKREDRKRKAEAERERRKLQAERRKKRVISLG